MRLFQQTGFSVQNGLYPKGYLLTPFRCIHLRKFTIADKPSNDEFHKRETAAEAAYIRARDFEKIRKLAEKLKIQVQCFQDELDAIHKVPLYPSDEDPKKNGNAEYKK